MGKPSNIKVKIYQSVEVSVAQVADNLAEKEAEAQAELFNKFAKSLLSSCEDKHHFELQLIGIADLLDGHGKRLIVQMADFIKTKSKEGKN